MMDGRSPVADHVARAAALGYPALALTDHGTMAGAAELYTECRKAGIIPMPGIEAYAAYGQKTRRTFHVGMVAVTQQGYLNLVQINNAMNEDYYYKPLLDLTRIADFDTDGIVMTSGCFFGLGLSAHRAAPEAALNVLSVLGQYFDLYLEAQCHGIVEQGHDDVEDQYTVLEWSRTLGLPMVLGQDCHYVWKDDRALHDTMKRLGSWSDDPDDAQFPGEYGYHMLDEATARMHFEPDVWEAGTAGLAEILGKADMSIPPLDRFDPILVRSDDEDARIRALCTARVEASVPPWDGRYTERMEDELAVIAEFGFTGYMLLVHDIVEHLRSRGIRFAIRGSASGSLVCHLLGITELDPIEWGLGFDRFLSRNRAKLPDIDIDVDSSRRDEVVAHLRTNYVVTSICNYGELGVAAWDGDYKGSAVVKWKQAQRKKNGTTVPDEHVYNELRQMCAEGSVLVTRGTHASGLVVAPDYKSMRWMPLARVGSSKSSDRFVTAFDMASTEAMGYVKVDILGLKALHAVAVACGQIGDGFVFEQIPLDDSNVYAMLGAGYVDGVFQLEGWAARKGIQRMQPREIGDVIAAMALFRPAAMDSGATESWLRRRRRAMEGAAKDWSGKWHPDIEDQIGSTYGVLLYQEQVIDILKSLGFGPDALGRALKAVKASNSNVAAAQQSIAELNKEVKRLAKIRGWSSTDVGWLATAFEAYANYGFNRAHATSYGILAYRTAWLSYHYPGQFWQGMITAHASDDEKVAEYTEQLAGRRFVRMPVDVNTCGTAIRVDIEKRRVYPALTSIKGIGSATAGIIARHQPYESLSDLAVRLGPYSGVSGTSALAAGTPPGECPGVIGILGKSRALRSLD